MSEKNLGNESEKTPLLNLPSNFAPKPSSEVQVENNEETGSGLTLGNSVADTVTANLPKSETVEKVSKFNNFAKNAVKLANAVSSTVGSVVSMLFNPIFWVVVAVAVTGVSLVLSTKATLQVVGSNENGSCDGVTVFAGGVGNLQLEKGSSTDIVKRNSHMLMGWLMSTPFSGNQNKPLNREQAAAVVSAMIMETSVLDPSMIQGGALSPDASNAEIRALAEAHGASDGRAVGLFQFRAGRLKRLVDMADAAGKKWNDAGVQMAHFKEEIDSGRFDLGEFFLPNKDLTHYTYVFNRKYVVSCRLIGPNDSTGCAEGSGESHWREVGNRHLSVAKDLATTYAGAGSNSGSSGGGGCRAGATLDTSSVANFAISIAYGLGEMTQALSHGSGGANQATRAYKEAKKKASELGGPDSFDSTHPGGYFADCGRFTATVIRNTVDKDFPWGNTGTQYAYMKQNTGKWKAFKNPAERQPGDVFVTDVNGHIFVYLGTVNGKDLIAEASHYDYVGILKGYYLDDNLVDNLGRAYTGFHFVGK